MKKLMGLILIFVILIGLVPVTAQEAPVLTGAYVVNNTQLLITFSEPVTLDLSKSTRFAMRVIDANNNMASGTTDAFQTMAEGKYTWANDEHTALIWTVAAATGHPATTAHWLEVAAQQKASGNRVAFCIIDLATTGDDNIDAVTANGVAMKKMNSSGAGMAVVEMTERAALTLDSAVAVTDTQVDLTFSEPIKISGSPMLAIRVVDPATDKIVSVSGNQLLAQSPDLTLSEDGQTLSWQLTDVSLADWIGKKTTYPQYAVKVCLLENPTNVNGKIDQVTDALSGMEGLAATYSESGNREAACVELTAIEPPTLVSATVINDTQLQVTFSESVTLDFGKSTRFAMRVIDANNNMAADTTDAYQTMTDETYTWANEEHTALIWTVPAATGHPASTAHWLEIAAQQKASGNRVAFCIIDTATVNDTKIDAVTANGVAMQKMNTSGAGMAVVELTNESFEACVDDQLYTTLGQALDAAQAGQTVTLLKNTVATGDISISAEVALDLRGYTLTADSVTCFGNVMDSTEGEGGIKTAKNTDKDNKLILQTSNTMLPLYDTAFEGYRFFTCTLRHLAKTEECKFGFQILEMSEAAYKLMVNEDDNDRVLDADIELITKLTVTADGTEILAKNYAFTADTLAEYADKTLTQEGNWAVTLTVTGFDQVDGTEVMTTSAPYVLSSTGVKIEVTADDDGSAATHTYIHTNTVQGE